jgi:L-lactate utilization protein LutC
MTTMEEARIERLPVNEAFARPAGDSAIERAAEALRHNRFDVRVVETTQEARDLVMSLIPDGSEVGQGASETLERIGVTAALDDDRYVAVRPKTRKMDRATQGREIRKLSSAPDVQVNSVHAVTEDGSIVIASLTGSQLGPIASGAGKVILVVGSQKIVPDLEAAFRRVREYSYPIEDARFQEGFGRRSAINKMLVINGDFPPGRTTVVLVREPVGV